MRCVLAMVRIGLGLALLVVMGSVAIAEGMSAKLEEVCRKHDLPAMTAVTLNSQGILEAKCFGVRKRGTKDQVELTDRFAIGSCTKSMTATLAAVLVESGKIEWNTTLGDVWPKATDMELHPELRTVTLDDLLSHQSGLPPNVADISNELWGTFFQEKQSPLLERQRMIRVVLASEPTGMRGNFAYSNLGYAIVSAMLETRAEKPFELLMKEHLFEPLEMKSADFRSMKSAKLQRPPLLWGHSANGDPVDPKSVGAENPTVYAAAGTVHLSIEDYAKYARWQLAGKSGPVLKSQAAFDHLHEPQVDYSLPGTKYACGWICLNSGLGPALHHGGSNTKSFALIWVFPKSDFAVIVCTNSGQKQAFPGCDEVIGQLLKEFAADKRPK
ncbi:MAG: serine hydrolase domain-containing protein [Planctomycetaceae bacterium]